MAHSCTSSDAAVADPAVRIGQLAQAFGANGTFLSACLDNFTPGFDRIGQLLSRAR
jgi:hypothetical protein